MKENVESSENDEVEDCFRVCLDKEKGSASTGRYFPSSSSQDEARSSYTCRDLEGNMLWILSSKTCRCKRCVRRRSVIWTAETEITPRGKSSAVLRKHCLFSNSRTSQDGREATSSPRGHRYPPRNLPPTGKESSCAQSYFH